MTRCTSLIVATACVLAGLTSSPTPARSAPTTAPTVPGSVLFHSPASSGIYVGSPDICICSDGTYLAKCDEFGPKAADQSNPITRVFRSRDRGVTWQPLATLDHLFWTSLTEHRGALYLIGVTHEYGELVVRKSTDGGANWTTPTDAKHGLIRTGQWHTAPVPVLEQGGRMWRAVEFAQGTGWGERFRPCVMSIADDADLLDADQWTVADPMPRDGQWLGGRYSVMLEGNLVPLPDGRIANVLRTDKDNEAAIAIVAKDGRSLSIDPALDHTPLSGTDKKFEIRWDDVGHCFWALCNPLPPDFDGNDPGGTRNVLALMRSTDLKTWERRCVLLYHPAQKSHAFQYPSWLIDGDDLILTSRTAYDDEEGPRTHRGHDANFLTFHRFPNFRSLTLADGIQVPEGPDATTPKRQRVGSLDVVGLHVDLAPLANGERAFANRPYVLEAVSSALHGWRFTRMSGGVASPLTITASSATKIRIATAEPDKLSLDGFTVLPELGFRYNDAGRTPIAVYERPLRAGESITLPSGNWSGCMLLVSP